MAPVMTQTKEPEAEYEIMRREFEAFWPRVVEEIRNYLKEATYGAPTNRIFNVLEENVPGGKKSRYV